MTLNNDPTLPDVSSMQLAPQRHQITNQIRLRNRRKRYLERHPGYFGPSLELADPLLYDRLIRRFQSDAERDTERQTKSYADTLEADLVRSEAKLAEAQQHASESQSGPTSTRTNPAIPHRYQRTPAGHVYPVTRSSRARSEEDAAGESEDGDESLTKEEATQLWRETMTERFLAGEDRDFDYSAVDGNEEYDDLAEEERDAQERWFDEEDADADDDGESRGRMLVGETGVQDF